MMAFQTSAPSRPQALEILLEASSLLLYARNEEELLAQTLDLASNLLVADAYGVWREFDEGRVWRIVAQRGLSPDYPRAAELNSASFPQGVWVIEDMQADPRAVFNRAVYQAEGIRSSMVVPWTLDKAVNGAIIYYWRTRRAFNQDDIDYALALSNLSASALNRIELNKQNQREKQRLAFLAEASAMLASSLDYQSTLDRVARLAVEQIAEWCTVHIAENGVVTRVTVAHADPAMTDLAREYSLRYPEQIVPDRGLGKVLATGVPEVVPVITDQMVAQAAQGEEHLAILRQFKLSSSMLIPLASREKVLGAIRLLGTHGRYFSEDDVKLALDLGRRAAIAVENAQLHRAVLEQETEIRLSHQAAKMGSWSWDLQRDTLFWSPEFRTLHGLSDDIVPTPEISYELVHPEDRDRAKREFWATVHSEAATFNSEHRSITPDRRVLWLQVRGRIRRDSTGKAVWIAGLIIDVTESRLAEQALRRADKLAAAGRFAATVAHEVNNPLESLVNLIYLAQRVEGLPDQAMRHLEVADGELRRIAHIVRQTLGFYRESTVPQPTGIVSLVTDVIDLYRTRASSRGLTLTPPPRSPQDLFAFVIAGEIKQVVANLIANAIDATSPGGVVQISVYQLEEQVEIVVADSGCGISEANRKHLFEPFFTTKADVGTGLGLWVSKGIVEKNRGAILVDGPSGIGATFRVRLPIQA